MMVAWVYDSPLWSQRLHARRWGVLPTDHFMENPPNGRMASPLTGGLKPSLRVILLSRTSPPCACGRPKKMRISTTVVPWKNQVFVKNGLAFLWRACSLNHIQLFHNNNFQIFNVWPFVEYACGMDFSFLFFNLAFSELFWVSRETRGFP